MNYWDSRIVLAVATPAIQEFFQWMMGGSTEEAAAEGEGTKDAGGDAKDGGNDAEEEEVAETP